MGFHFSLKNANIVAYLTDQKAREAPRIKSYQLYEFLAGLNEARRYPGDNDHPRGFISSRNAWAEQFDMAALEAFQKIERLPWRETEFMDSKTAEQLLAHMRRLLSDYSLFGLTVRGDSNDEALDSFAHHAAFSSDHHALFLITHPERTDQVFDWLDPFPALGPLAEDSGERPGMLFWTPDGTSVYAPLRTAQLIYAKLLLAFEAGNKGDIGEILLQHRRLSSAKRILHLSDLHLGTETAAENQELLLQNLQRVIPTVDRVVITGDLFDEPKRSYSIHYRNFELALRRFSDKSPVIIPGNHDQKRMGNVLPIYAK
jgi:Calcineurin-like phosphoesterase